MDKEPKSCGFGKRCKNPKPANRKMYKKIKNSIIHSSDKWPSRYASYELINNYKKAGGKYRCNFGHWVTCISSFHNVFNYGFITVKKMFTMF